MKKFMALSALMLLSLTALHAEESAPHSEDKARETVAVSQKVYEQLLQAQEQVNAQQYTPALTILAPLLEQENLTHYERAQANNLYAYIHYLREDYKKAIKYYEAALSSEELPEALLESTLHILAQLYFLEKNYPKTIENIDRLMKQLTQPEPGLYLLLAQAYFQMNRYSLVIPATRNAIRLYRERDKLPEESWLLLLYASYYELEDYTSLLELLQELIFLYPRERHLLALAGVYGKLQDAHRQLALIEALYESGAMYTSSQVVNLVNLYLLQDLPYKAAKVMQKALDEGLLRREIHHLNLAAQAWQQAQEHARAIEPLTQAAVLAEDGTPYVRLAQLHLQLEQWSEAAQALRKALAKGGLERRHEVNLMLGIALFNQQYFSDARDAFEAASHDNRGEKSVDLWLAQIDHELELQRLLDSSPEIIKDSE